MKKEKVIVLGGTQDHIDLIKILKNKKFHVLLVDYTANPSAKCFADEYIQESTLNKEAVLEIAIKNKVSFVIAACIDQALLTMAYVCEQMGLPCHLTYDKALSLTNKTFMKEVFKEYGVPTAKFQIVDDIQSSELEISYPLVVKPSDANSSKGVIKVKSENELKASMKEAMQISRDKKIIVEEFIAGKEYSADVLISDGKAEALMISENVKFEKNHNNFTIVQSLFNSEIHNEHKSVIEQIAIKISQAFDLKNVLLLIQLIINDDGVFVIEFSSRIGGGSKHHFIKKIRDYNVLDCFLATIERKTIRPKNNMLLFKNASVNYIYTKKGVFNKVIGVELLLEKKIIEDFYLYKNCGTEITNNISSSDRPAGYLIADNDNLVYQHKFETAKKEIEILGEDGINLRII
ncbi:ATP-grasp domain-containing protein [Polaribacter sp. MSW13]|uniref:ATP-grasp domain-containing protein n=1 Tax=Polaribacter marinus TaxID=2916838 RepID=A0A9X1VLV9_9FLAO|nr:ATP-grasp domain-containing protein [Polaribacter marinus]MCI2228378.1 ATP-grasp domain-containing protein [Polaribacter marinus]